jgi:signal transduction histidine kinase
MKRFILNVLPATLISSWTNARLKVKFMVALVGIGLFAVATTIALLATVIIPRFSELEEKQVTNQIDRTKAAVDEFSMRVATAVKDYAAWDDSFNYLSAPSHSFEEETLSILAMSNLDVNGMAYARFDGKILASNWINIAGEREDPGLLRQFNALITAPELIAHTKSQSSLRFYAKIGNKVAAISAARVVKTNGSGESKGFVVMARELTSARLSDLLQMQTKLSVSDRKLAPLSAKTSDKIEIAVDVPGISGRVGQAKFSVGRQTSAIGHNMLLYAGLSCTLVLALVLLFMQKLLRAVVAQRLHRVERHMANISLSGQLRPLEVVKEGDEIGSLVDHLNEMLLQMKELREQVEFQSFKLGKTESAVGVMHNVRNGLNPVSVILARAMEYRPAVSLSDVAKAMAELSSEKTDAVRRQKLIAFLRAALDAQNKMRSAMQEELITARSCLSDVVDMIGKQQALAHEGVETESCNLGDVLNQNAALARYAKQLEIQFSVPEEEVFVRANRLLLSQVVGNVFANAVEAITGAKRAAGRIEVSYHRGDDWIDVRVRDNGEGFDPSRVKQFFERGYSSREHKSGGLGLHWCANAVNLMNGQIEMVSDGPGLGATLIIRLQAANDCNPDLADRSLGAAQQYQVRDNALAVQAQGT